MDFMILVHHRVKVKENKKIDKYQDLAGVLINLWNMKMTMVPSVVGALGIVPKSLEKRLEEHEIRGRSSRLLHC